MKNTRFDKVKSSLIPDTVDDSNEEEYRIKEEVVTPAKLDPISFRIAPSVDFNRPIMCSG